MSSIVSEIAKTVGDTLRKAFPQLQSNQKVRADPSDPTQPISGVIEFLGNLFANSHLSGFLAGGVSKDAVVRGSLVGLASGLEAVTDEGPTGKTVVEQEPLRAAITISAYIVGGILAALVFLRLRGASQMPSTKH